MPEYRRLCVPGGSYFFTVALRDSNGMYRSWPTSRVKYGVDSPVEAHVDLFGKYTDADIHNLMAYLQTLR